MPPPIIAISHKPGSMLAMPDGLHYTDAFLAIRVIGILGFVGLLLVYWWFVGKDQQLWLAVNHRSDTLPTPLYDAFRALWLAVNRRSDTLDIQPTMCV